MPAAPLLVIGASATGAAAAIGSTVAAAVGLGTVSAAAATAIGAGVISGGITAIQGGDAGDILKSAVVGGGAGYLGGVAGTATKGALAGSTSQAVSNVVSSAASGATSSAAGALAYGASPEQALESGLKGAAVSGLTQAGVEGAKAARTPGPQQAGEARLKVPQQRSYEPGMPLAETPQSVGITGKVPTGGGQGLVASPDQLYASSFAPSQPMREKEGGGVQPAYQRAETLITPDSMLQYTQPYRETKEFNPPPLTRREETLLSETLGLGLGEAFASRPSTPTQPEAQGAYLGGQGTPGSQALAQALRTDSGAALFGSEKEGKRRNVWNVESLKYKDEMGA
jgi:hypothetical protein